MTGLRQVRVFATDTTDLECQNPTATPEAADTVTLRGYVGVSGNEQVVRLHHRLNDVGRFVDISRADIVYAEVTHT